MNWRALLGERIRQNHAIEHATMAMLQERDPNIKLVARSNSRGFRLYGTVSEDDVRWAAGEALRRLRLGEHQLAITPRCGTTIAVGVVMGTLGLWVTDMLRSPRHKLVAGLVTSVAIAASSLPVSTIAQRYVTTQSAVGQLELQSVRSRRGLARTSLCEVITG